MTFIVTQRQRRAVRRCSRRSTPTGTLTYTPAANATVGHRDRHGARQRRHGERRRRHQRRRRPSPSPSCRARRRSACRRATSLVVEGAGDLQATVVSAPVGNLSGQSVTFKNGTVTIGTGVLNARARRRSRPRRSRSARADHGGVHGDHRLPGQHLARHLKVILPSATLTVNFTVHALMDNTNKPKVQDVPVANAEVRVYERRDHAPTATSSRATRGSGASCMTALTVRGPFRDARS